MHYFCKNGNKFLQFRFFGDTVKDKHDIQRPVVVADEEKDYAQTPSRGAFDSTTFKESTRAESPIYSSVYERYKNDKLEILLFGFIKIDRQSMNCLETIVRYRFERKEDADKTNKGFATSTPHVDRQRPPTPPRDFNESSISKSPEAERTPFYSGYIVEEKRYR